MKIEDDIFKRYKVDFQKLKDYGFKIDNYIYIYEKIILNDFKVIVIVEKHGKVSGKVIDLEFNNEFTNIRINNTGEFVNKVRDEYIKILKDIRDKCFSFDSFIYEQTKRITKYILDKYGVSPEFLWDKTPGCGVFRNKSNNKWFGIIMNIDKSKLDDGSGEVEIINIKLDEEVSNLLNNKGFYPAYHMNKKSWISIILDDTLSDRIINNLIDKLFDIISSVR